jgi:hypothetical protein
MTASDQIFLAIKSVSPVMKLGRLVKLLTPVTRRQYPRAVRTPVTGGGYSRGIQMLPWHIPADSTHKWVHWHPADVQTVPSVQGGFAHRRRWDGEVMSTSNATTSWPLASLTNKVRGPVAADEAMSIENRPPAAAQKLLSYSRHATQTAREEGSDLVYCWFYITKLPLREAETPTMDILTICIRSKGSITVAAQHLGMSYRSAWVLAQQINDALQQPAVTTSVGGSRGSSGGDLGWRGGHQALSLDRRENAHVSTPRVFGAR